MREAGDICYAEVSKDGTGVVEYINYDDMKYAVRKLDDTKFKSHEVGEFLIANVWDNGFSFWYLHIRSIGFVDNDLHMIKHLL